jgi:sRNA-binding carbon storage regulator CsrA
MRILKRRIGHALVGEADAHVQRVEGYRMRIGQETPAEAPAFREEVLRELSKAAREALAPVRRADNE